jgi:hypothetical protein
MSSAIRIIILQLSFFCSFHTLAQEVKLFQDVEDALQASSSRDLSQHLNDYVELKLNGKRKEYSNNQAQAILKQFFQENSAVTCEFLHNGQNNAGGIIYAIGNYKTTSTNYRVVVRAKKFKEEYKLYRIEFTKER